jgi:hypothetical protein
MRNGRIFQILRHWEECFWIVQTFRHWKNIRRLFQTHVLGFWAVLAFFVADGVTLLFFLVDGSCCLLMKDVLAVACLLFLTLKSVIRANDDGILVLVWSVIHVW